MAGLFTLDSTTLGVIGTNVLGGPGTGFVIGTTSSAGTVAGVMGLSGSALGAQTSSGAAAGSPALSGTATGAQTSAGTVVGVEGARGVVIGSAVSNGSAQGFPALLGVVVASGATAGRASGAPSLSGSASGASVSTGSASGSVPTPPTPPAPTPSGGGGYRYYQPKVQAVANHGAVAGSSVSAGRISGRRATNGSAVGVCTSAGIVRGVSRLSVARVRYVEDTAHRARMAEDELLILELL